MSEGEHTGWGRRERPASAGARALAALPGALIRMVRRPVIPVLIAAGVVDALSGGPIGHGLLLVAVALALAIDTVRRRSMQPARSTEVEERMGPDEAVAIAERPLTHAPGFLRLTPRLFLGGLAYAVIVGAFTRYSWPVTFAVMVPAVAGIVVAWRTPSLDDAEPVPIERAGAFAWAAVFIALGLWELAALLLQPDLVTMSYAHPTVSALMDPVLASHAGRSATLFVWLGLGWFLLQR